MKKMKFEESLKRLEEIVQEFEKGEISLEDSIEAFKEGTELIRMCEKKLQDAEKKITELIDGEEVEVKDAGQ